MTRLAHAEDAAAADIDLLISDVFQRFQAILEGPGADDIAIKFRRSIQVVVVIIQAGLFQAFRLRFGQHAPCHAGLHPHIVHRLDHLNHPLQILIGRVSPGSSHAKTGRPFVLGVRSGLDHLIDRKQFLFFQIGVVLGALRAVTTILGTGAGFDTQQCADLNPVGIEMLPVDCLSLKQQIIEREIQ